MMKNNFELSNEIRDLAELTALEYEEFQTPLDRILIDEEIVYIEDEYGDFFDGLTVYDNQFFIHLNTYRGNFNKSERGRFTLAHELGHCIIDRHRKGLMSGILMPHPSKSNQSFNIKIEREADYFASCLLMPSFKFSKLCESQTFNFELIEKIANIFHVSLTAAALRFSQIGNHPIIVVFSKGKDIDWYWPSYDFPFKNLKYNKDNIPNNTLMGDYFSFKKKYDESLIVNSEDWFLLNKKEDKGREFNERCIYGPEGVLSIIWE